MKIKYKDTIYSLQSLSGLALYFYWASREANNLLKINIYSAPSNTYKELWLAPRLQNFQGLGEGTGQTVGGGEGADAGIRYDTCYNSIINSLKEEERARD